MKLFAAVLIFTVVILLGWEHLASAEVEWTIQKELKLEHAPIDMVVSNNGDWIYILTEEGDILVYASSGQLEDTIHVGNQITCMEVGPSEGLLLIGSGKGKTVQTLSLEFVREIDVSGAPALGLPDAPVTIAVFMDYQCPYCARLAPVLEQVLEKNPEDVKIVYKQYPLKMHKAALSAAAASLVADREGQFREFHALMLDDYKTLTDENVLDKASSLGFDRDLFQKKMASPAVLRQIQKDMQDGKQAGISGIPSVFINGRSLKSRSLEGFQQLIDQELKKLGLFKAAGES